MRKTLLITVLLGMALLVNAIPAYNVWQVFQQPDGSLIRLLLVGDEHLHYYMTDDHAVVIQDKDAFYYAQCSGNHLRPSSLLAHEQELRTMAEWASLIMVDEAERLRPRLQRKSPAGMARQRKSPYVGERKGLVILVDFSDRKFFDAEEQGEEATLNRYMAMLNQSGYTNDLGAIGSVHDYFLDQSGGAFSLSFDVVGPITMPQPSYYYGQDLGKNSFDLNVPEMLVEACTQIDNEVDFSKYDWDGDGMVEEVFLLYAGYGQATGGTRDTIWPHMWSLTEAKADEGVLNGPVAFDGVWVDVYACSNELYGKKGTSEMGIGTFCHEFSHCLGLPDLYDVDNQSLFSLGSWDLMSNGNYNGPGGRGWVPAGYSACERWLAGWLQPTELHNDTVVNDMPPLAEQPTAYVIYNDAYRNEYYILENRSKTVWDAYLPGQGLLISHVDYDEQAWMANTVNTLNGFDHRHLTFFNASGMSSGWKNVYPYESNDSLTDHSSPAATLFHANTDGSFLMHKPVSDITRDEASSLISFRFANLNNSTSSIALVEREGKIITDVYSLDGRLLTDLLPHDSSIDSLKKLPPGFYIVRYSDDTTRKLLIR